MESIPPDLLPLRPSLSLGEGPGVRLHPIPIPILRMHPAPQLRQQAGERRTRTILQRSGILALHCGIDFGGRHQAGTLLARLGEAEARTDQFFGRRDAIERAIGLLNFVFLFLAEPAAFAIFQLVQQLGIKLFIIYRGVAVNGAFHLHTDEAAAARKVSQQVAAVAGTDK